ncbi:probable amino acid racemase [Brevibacillus brevis NBRC 100599]|uniref:Alanine racemase n=1 Tax=Brevibacillus brevis (strain 47 / JCM 6285 / NBRC 100599) TaxID=358681 RepID=C0ZKB5_BREBN|nr:serine racemase VanT catalytic subunit [Brevibacillus brevis]BAH41566.1 probable amino acid racemase [Brevibacillus brevis NBRC 100599]
MNVGSEKQYGGLDRFGIIAAILVIAIHTFPLLSISEWADFTLRQTIARVAVPFFFMCTGFFFMQKLGSDRNRNASMLKQLLWKVGKLYLLSILLYFPVNVYEGYFTDGFTLLTAVKDLLFNGTLYHLWYFPGIMLGVCINTFLYTRLSTWNAFWVTLLLYGIGLLGDSYFGLVHFTLVTVLSFVLSVLAMKAIQRFRGGKPDQTGRAWADIHLPHLQHNVREIQQVLPKDCAMMAVVKAQAYGHGGWQIARFLNKLGIDHFAVATIDEGIELRKKGVKGEILVLGYTDERRIRQIARFKLTQTVVDDEYAQTLNGYNVKIPVHIKIDTGMGRLGESWEYTEKIAAMYRYKHLQVCGTFTHLSVADSLEASDIAYTKNQIDRFQNVIEQLKEKGINPQKLHVQSSYGVLNYGELQYDYARMGIALYGMLSKQGDKVKTSIDLRPVLSLKARVVQVKQVEKGAPVGYGRAHTAQKDSKIAIVSIGYADGVPRMLSQVGATCLIRGKRRPIIGFVCMDQLIVDISDIEEVQRGEVVTFIGRDQEEEITAEEMAQSCKTITNELVSRLGERVKRVYHD